MRMTSVTEWPAFVCLSHVGQVAVNAINKLKDAALSHFEPAHHGVIAGCKSEMCAKICALE